MSAIRLAAAIFVASVGRSPGRARIRRALAIIIAAGPLILPLTFTIALTVVFALPKTVVMLGLDEAVEADDGEVVGNRDPPPVRGTEDAERHLIAAGEDGVQIRFELEQLLEGKLAAGRRPVAGHGGASLDAGVAERVVLDLDGTIVEGGLKPSSDTASHLYIYRHRPDINGVVHTHSRYATAFAAVGRPIPVYLTAQADEFGGEIPCAGFALVGDWSWLALGGDISTRGRRHLDARRPPTPAAAVASRP